MSSKKGLENKGNKGILTRQTTQNDPELKKQVDQRNNEANVFGRKPRVPRSPPRINLNNLSTHTYVNITPNSITGENTEKTLSPTTSKTDLNVPEITDSHTTDNSEQNQNDSESTQEQNIPTISINNLLIPELKQEVVTPTEFYTANTPGKTFAFFDESINLGNDKHDYTDIEGLLNQQSLILANQNNINNSEQGEIEIHGNIVENLIDFKPEMANQALKLPLKEVAKLVPDFDGNNIPLDEYIERLKQAKKIIAATDEQNLIQFLKIKLKGETYKALTHVDIPNIETFIQTLRKLYPSTDDIYALYGKLTQQIQRSDEDVLHFANKLRVLSSQILDLKKLEPNITQDILTQFKTELQNTILSSFKKGLKQEIRIELGEQQNIDEAIQKAIEIELNLKKQSSLRNNTSSLFFNFEIPSQNKIKPLFCQLCKEINHEALFCIKASCVYCKSREHVSYHCRATNNVIPLICKLCSTKGHSIDACKISKVPNNHCQYCQNMGHDVTECPTIAQYELCWKCKEGGHDPFTCNKAAKISESCEVCGTASHTAKNCPSALCKRCNNVGHLMKYCTINKRTIWCAICADEGHEAVDCENAKILMMQNRQQNLQNREICQICEMPGHTARTCRKTSNKQQSAFPSNNYNSLNRSYEHWDKNRNGFFRTNNQNDNNFSRNSNNNYRGNFNTQVIKCEYCKFTGHKLEDCRKLKNLTEQFKCTFCHKNGHELDNCHELKRLQDKSNKFCRKCKNTTHTTEECISRPTFNQQNSEN